MVTCMGPWKEKHTWDAVAVAESLQLTVSPGVQDPILGISRCLSGTVLNVVPVSLDLINQSLERFIGMCLDVSALGLQE